MINLVFVCEYCGAETSPEINTQGDMPSGVLVLCQCKESMAAWEAQHRAEMERRKKLRPKPDKFIHQGRTPHPSGKKRR